MNVKIFKIRLTKKELIADQNELNTFLDSVNIKKTAVQLIEGPPEYWSVMVFFTNEKTAVKSGEKISFAADIDLSEEEKKIYDTLKQWRADKAGELKLPTYLVTSNSELISVAKVKPQTTDELIKIRGFAGQKVAKYGSDIIAVLNSVG
jgi:superfamily II DNA helicase RecQ